METKHTPKADVRVHLTNPESGYVSETTAKVTPNEWAVIDRVLCGSGAVYTAAPELLEALKVCEAWIVDLANSGDAGFWDASETPEVVQARAAIAKATGAA